MNGRAVLAWCRAQPEVTEGTPFGPDALVFKINGRMFAATPVADDPDRVTLKSDPEFAEILRQEHPAIRPGYHMNKRHWSTVMLDGTVPTEIVAQLLEQAYGLVKSARSKPTS